MEVFSTTYIPSIKDRNNAFIALSCNAKESRHGHVEVMVRWVTPPSMVIRRAKVCGGYCHAAANKAPFWVCPKVTHHLVACTTNLTVSEQHSAHRCGVHTKPRMKGIIVATCSPCKLIYCYKIHSMLDWSINNVDNKRLLRSKGEIIDGELNFIMFVIVLHVLLMLCFFYIYSCLALTLMQNSNSTV